MGVGAVINCGDGWGEHPTQCSRTLHDWSTSARLTAESAVRGRHAYAHDALDPLRHVPVSTWKASWCARRDVVAPEFKASSTSAT